MKLSILIVCAAALLTGCATTSAMNSPEADAEKAAEVARQKAADQLHEIMARLANGDNHETPQAGLNPSAGI